MPSFRITLSNDLLPVQAYLNCWPDGEFLPMLRRMAAGVESIHNDAGWSWWRGEDDAPPPPGTLLFFIHNEEVALPASEALAYIEQATEAWLAHHPDKGSEARTVLREIRQRFLPEE